MLPITDTSPNKIAFIFPGQGSQALGMLASFSHVPIIQQTFKEASSVLGSDLWQLAQMGPLAHLNQTAYTQPLLLTAGVALWRLWQSVGGSIPMYLAGHSLGEYTALTCAETVDFKAAVQLVANRGRYMQEAVPEGEGAMAAIVGLEDPQITALCLEAAQGEVLAPANYNLKNQIVLSGHSAAIDRAVGLAKQMKAILAKRIPVSVPAHCCLMQSAAKKLAIDFKQHQWSPPKIPVVNNLATVVETTPIAIQQALLKQVYSAVLWGDCVQYLLQQGVNYFIECGPGKVLSGLIKRSAPSTVKINSLGEYADFQAALSGVLL
jgi:[acyl-carrier-protein] S-malonyltransferase